MVKKTHSRTPRPGAAKSPVRPQPRLGWVAALDAPGLRIGLILLVVVLAVSARMIQLGADPPLDLSWSQDLFTDPPQYTSYARNAILFGQWNPLNDARLVFFQKNITGLIAYTVFLFTGPGVAAGQFVAVLMNLLGIAFLAFGAYRAFGFLAAWSTAFFLAVNYFFVGYGRLPFLEVASNAALALAFLSVVSSSRHWRWALIAGLAAGIGTFFGKVTALHAVPVLMLTAGLIGWQSRTKSKVERWLPFMALTGGVLLVYGIWYVYAYGPASAEVLAYLREQTLALYGTPVGLTSVQGFISRWFSFGLDNPAYPNSPLTWSPVLGVLGVAGMALMIIRSFRGAGIKDWLANMSPACLALVGWFWSAYAAFMPFNYRPARYQVVLLLPLAAAAGWLVGRLASKKTHTGDRKMLTSWVAFPLLVVVLATGLQHLLISHIYDQSRAGSFYDGVMLAVILAAVVSAIWIALARKPSVMKAGRMRSVAEIAVAVGLVLLLVNQGRHFTHWWSARQHSIEDANRDLQMILGEDAILTGGYGSALSQGERIGNFPAMFGVSKPDFEFFRKFPVTHIVEVDQPNQPFFKTYPVIAAESERVTTYTIRNLPIGVYRVAQAGGNAQAAQYQPTPFERMRSRMKNMHRDSVLAVLPAWLADSADTYSGWRWLGDLYYSAGRLADALDAYDRATQSFPDDFTLWAMIGDVSWEVYRTGAGNETRLRAVDAWERASRLNPRNRQLADRLARAYRQ